MLARLSRSRGQFVAYLILLALALWGAQHILVAWQVGSINSYLYSHWAFLVSFVVVALSMWLAQREKPLDYNNEMTVDGHEPRVTAVVPCYNEDASVLRDVLHALVLQSRPLQSVYLIDDGSSEVDYRGIQAWFEPYARRHGVEPVWLWQPNAGKRQAQAQAFRRAPDADIFITVDSDSIIDFYAIEEIMKPFANTEIQSVAGVVLAKNNRSNLLARLTDLLFVTGQLTDRSMMSTLGSVLVNSGGLAAYRAEVVRDNLEAYLEETFLGKQIEFSDDSMLTLYALMRGKTVQQPTAFVLTMMPDRLSHHYRQQLRWMKGSFIRSWWRLKYLPLTSFGFIRQFIGWTQFVMTTMLLALILFSQHTLNTEALPYLLLVPIVIGYAQALRYFSVQRTDESIWSQLYTYALTPVAVLWSYFVLRPIRLYAAVTCMRGGWGTRRTVEITLNQALANSPLRRLSAYARFSLRFSKRYELLMKRIYAATSDAEERLTLWHQHYHTLSDRDKFALWRDYYKAQYSYAKRATL